MAATIQYDADGAPAAVLITWDASLEEASGERDVATYVVQRRRDGELTWTTLRNSAASGDASYAVEDFELGGGDRSYGVIAQDCSPANSSLVTSALVDIP